MTTRNEVVEFLSMVKACIDLGYYRVRDREKNHQGLLDLGITVSQRRDILLGLTPEDYYAGPKPDDTDEKKDVWEFGKNIASVEVYIKLRIAKDPHHTNVYRVLVWSFHPAEFPIAYPLRQNHDSQY